jgi:hypothetical protein
VWCDFEGDGWCESRPGLNALARGSLVRVQREAVIGLLGYFERANSERDKTMIDLW